MAKDPCFAAYGRLAAFATSIPTSSPPRRWTVCAIHSRSRPSTCMRRGSAIFGVRAATSRSSSATSIRSTTSRSSPSSETSETHSLPSNMRSRHSSRTTSAGWLAGTGGLQDLPHARKRAELDGPNSVRPAPQPLRHLVVRQSFEEPQEHHNLLFARQLLDGIVDGAYIALRELLAQHRGGLVVGDCIQVVLLPSVAKLIHRAVTRYGEHPGDRCAATRETVAAAPGTEVNLRGHVFGEVCVADEHHRAAVDRIAGRFV